MLRVFRAINDAVPQLDVAAFADRHSAHRQLNRCYRSKDDNRRDAVHPPSASNHDVAPDYTGGQSQHDRFQAPFRPHATSARQPGGSLYERALLDALCPGANAPTTQWRRLSPSSVSELVMT